MDGTNKFYFICEIVLKLAFYAVLLQAAAASEEEQLQQKSWHKLNIGVITALDTAIGKVAKTAIELAVEDVNREPNLLNATLLNVDIRDSTQDAVQGASAALELLRKECVAIVGPQTSVVAEFVAYLSSAAHVPIVSFSATNPSLSLYRYPYFIRTSQNDEVQMKAIAGLVQYYRWRDVVVVYADDDYGMGAIPALNDALRAVQAKIVQKTAVSPQANVSVMRRVLRDQLMKRESRVFIVHMHPEGGVAFFAEAKKMGMVGNEYAWILSEGIGSLLDSFNTTSLMSMQGVLAVRNKIPKPNQPRLMAFTARWKKRFKVENPTVENPAMNFHGLIAYDTVWVIARAIDHLLRAGLFDSNFSVASAKDNGRKWLDLKVFQGGDELKKQILDTNFSGLSGPVGFNTEKGEPLSFSYEIVNVVGSGGYQVVGSWMEPDRLVITSRHIVWPGGGRKVPRGWIAKKLKIAVPWEPGFREFISVKPLQGTNNQSYEITGFCIDVFKAVLNKLDYELLYELVPYGTGNITAGYYDDLVYQVYLKKFDAVVGDVAVFANRSKYVDFTQPFTETGLVMTVRIQDDRSNDPWAFLRPFTPAMWITTLAFFFFTGAVVWLLEHRSNKHFRGEPRKQVLTFLWFSFSTLFYTQRERVVSGLGRTVLIIWLFVVLVLASSYTASLSSMLTVRQIVPEVQSVESLISNKLPIGYRQGTFIGRYLKQELGVDKSLLRPYSRVEDYAIALNMGAKHGGVAAIFDEETVAQNVFLSRSCNAYTKVGPTYRTGGLAFVFPKGSPLVSDISKAILNLSESKEMQTIRERWFNNSKIKCNANTKDSVLVESNRLSLKNFWGVFLVTGCVSSLTLIYYFCRLFYRYLHRPPPDDYSHSNSRSHSIQNSSISRRLEMFVRYADEMEIPPPKRKRSENTASIWSRSPVSL
uniref:Glutamate receptor n=1 Tax=Wollemia nobilis TaxID=56998 RepID=A0A0C9S6M2_9CONI